jgi:hypothetical protein
VRKRKTGAPGAIPTRDLPLRRRTLYAAELREHWIVILNGRARMVKRSELGDEVRLAVER